MDDEQVEKPEKNQNERISEEWKLPKVQRTTRTVLEEEEESNEVVHDGKN